MSSSPTPEGLLRFGRPNFLDGFTARSPAGTSTCVNCVHAVIGGEGSPLLLVHGCPYLVRLADADAGPHSRHARISPSDKVPDGYDTGTSAATWSR